MTHITWIMSHYFGKSDSDNAFQQSKILILHLVCSHLPEGSRDPDTAWNTTEQGWLMKMIWTSFRVSMWNEIIWGHFCQKPYGSIRKYWTGLILNSVYWNEKAKTINLRIKISIDVVYVFWAIVHNNFSFEWFRIWPIYSFMITESRVSVFLLVSSLFLFFEIANIKFHFWSFKNF